VAIEWDSAGTLTRVIPGAVAGGEPVAAGPVLPGMANVHSHAFQRAMAGLAEFRGHPTDDFWTWREEMYRLVARVDPDDVEAIARYLYIEMLRHGYTAVAEFHYLHHDRDGRPYDDRAEMANRIIAAAGNSGIALTLLPVLYAHGGFGHRPLSPAQKRFASDPAFVISLVEEISAFNLPDPMLRLGVAPHSVRAVDALLLTEMLEAANRFDATMPVHMHVSEQSGEVAECIETHGATPLDWIRDLVAVDDRWCLIHATHLTQIEARSLDRTGTVAGLCPVTEANLGDGTFEFVPWFEARKPWAIGGDSHVSVSPFEELRALEYSQRLRHRRATWRPTKRRRTWRPTCGSAPARAGPRRFPSRWARSSRAGARTWSCSTAATWTSRASRPRSRSASRCSPATPIACATSTWEARSS